jgi:hypothetical protein
MLRSAFEGKKPGAGPQEAMVINELVVNHLSASNMDAGKTRMGIDPFAPALASARGVLGKAENMGDTARKRLGRLF